MAQELVTARDVAAPAGVTLDLYDPQPICDKLDEALTGDGYHRTAFSRDSRHLFQLAWAVASHKQSTQVTVYHLVYALICAFPDAGRAVAEHLNSDADSLAVGCILKILNLGVSTGDAKLRPPAVGTVRWLGQAVALARMGTSSELVPGDLVRAVVGGRLHEAELRDLKRAARVGNARNGTVLGQKRLPAPTSTPEIIKHLEVVENGRGEPGSDMSDLVEMLEAFEERYSTDAREQKEIVSRLAQLVQVRLAAAEAQAVPIRDVMHRLDTIDHSVSALAATLPRPPSGVRLAATIAAVLAVGLCAGLALTSWTNHPSATNAVAATAK